MNSLLYANGEVNNLGCEALSKSTVSILRELNPEMEIDITTHNYSNNKEYLESFADKAVRVKRGREDLFNIVSEVLYRLGLRKLSLLIPNVDAARISKGYDYTFALGGDNYCYSGNGQYYRLNNGIRKNKSINVFWGCSIEPKMIDKAMIADLKGYDYIFPRESITAEAIKKAGIKNVFLCSDPAFYLKPQALKFEEEGEFIGINLSPMIYKCSDEADIVKNNVIESLKYILNNTKYKLCFIPHVYGAEGDYLINKDIAESLNAKERIVLIEEKNNANETKYLISKMTALICARTHASIAGYSSCIPTYVLGYSIKSKGIALDIFGSYEHHVLPVQDMNSKGVLIKELKDFIDRIHDEREFLEKKMPQYIENTFCIDRVFKNETQSK